MDKVQTPNNSECYELSSEPFRIYQIYMKVEKTFEELERPVSLLRPNRSKDLILNDDIYNHRHRQDSESHKNIFFNMLLQYEI
jgi:hypothetical protein